MLIIGVFLFLPGPTAEAPSDVPTDSSDPDQEYVHLGFFLDRRGMYKCLKQEGKMFCGV